MSITFNWQTKRDGAYVSNSLLFGYGEAGGSVRVFISLKGRSEVFRDYKTWEEFLNDFEGIADIVYKPGTGNHPIEFHLEQKARYPYFMGIQSNRTPGKHYYRFLLTYQGDATVEHIHSIKTSMSDYINEHVRSWEINIDSCGGAHIEVARTKTSSDQKDINCVNIDIETTAPNLISELGQNFCSGLQRIPENQEGVTLTLISTQVEMLEN